jgi:hypothetical protein
VESRKERARRYRERELKRLTESGIGLEELQKADTDGEDEAAQLASLVTAPRRPSGQGKKNFAPLAVGKEVRMGDYVPSQRSFDRSLDFEVEDFGQGLRSGEFTGSTVSMASPEGFARATRAPLMSPFEDAGSKEHLTPREAYDPDEGKPKRVVTRRARGTATSLRWPFSRSLAHAFSLSLSLFRNHLRSHSLLSQRVFAFPLSFSPFPRWRCLLLPSSSSWSWWTALCATPWAAPTGACSTARSAPSASRPPTSGTAAEKARRSGQTPRPGKAGSTRF